MEALKNLGVNGPFFISQLVNFAILFFLLKRFLYKPILEMLEKRRVEIERGLAEARRIAEEGKKFDAEHAAMFDEAKKEAKQIMDSAVAASGKIKDQMIKEADEKSKEMLVLAAKRAEDEHAKMLSEVKDEIRSLAREMAETILREHIDPSAEKKYIERTVK